MAASNRGTRLTKLVSILKKKFKPTAPVERPLFESLLYACLLENSTHEAAEESIRRLESGYFDWNEVRVSTRTELAKSLQPLSDPAVAADRLKRSLQSIFESIYAFDLESCKKQNLGQSVKQFAAYDGVTPFAVSYVTQNGLSGHSIALNKGALIAFHVFNLISDAELKKGVVPGLERAVPKSSAIGVGSLIHQLGVEVGRNPYSPAVRKLLLDIDPNCKDRLPKREPKPKPVKKPAAKKSEKAPVKETPAPKKGAAKAAAPKVSTAKKPDKKAAKASGKKKPVAKKPATKKPAKKKVVKKKVATKATSKKPDKKKAAAKKPATKKAPPKKAAKKGAAKKVAKKKTAKKSAAASKKKRKPR